MPSKRSLSLVVWLLAVGLASWWGASVAAQVNLEKWHLIRIPDLTARRAAIAALEAAVARLRDADCRKVLTDFDNGDGVTLADQLSSLGVDIPDYFAMITFLDDSRHRHCRTGALFFTTPGSRVVRVCTDELTRINADHPQYVTASVIHEILHTLGLGETPPSSREITARVMSRCRLR
jgi:hypothetical protein